MVRKKIRHALLFHRIEFSRFLTRCDGRRYPVEIKSGQTVSADMLSGLRWWCDLSGQPLESATLVHGGRERYIRNGVAVRPWFGV